MELPGTAGQRGRPWPDLAASRDRRRSIVDISSAGAPAHGHAGLCAVGRPAPLWNRLSPGGRLDGAPGGPMRVSVVMPVYNELTTINEIVQQVLDAPIKESLEIVVVDDGSTDGTREHLRALALRIPQ